jgi:2,5-diamino-6-(ribosylamino)-4(3H)-pyrimidinone 5'-phosphate reductase
MSSPTLATSPPEFLRRCLKISGDRPLVTLTWAQSLDSKIAGPGGKRVMISGDESMLMTHW